MSFDQFERSVAAGNPRRLYEFVRGAQRWRYTGGDRDVLLDTQVYRAAAISDDGIRQSGHVAGDGLRVGQDVVAYPGCARTIAICQSKFNNAPNFGGVPGLPGKSPFDGTPIF